MRIVVFLSVLGAAVFFCRWNDNVVLSASTVSDPAAGESCNPACDYCWCGTGYENNCPTDWFYDADCDCGCQFCDMACSDCAMQECGGGPELGACCCPDLTCHDTISPADCVSADCAYRGNGSSCSQGCPCDGMPLPCEFCWLGTSFENNCPADWRGTNDGCDCGCQWHDPDCGGTTEGARCCPDLTCYDAVSQDECVAAECVYRGDGSSCSQGCPCDEMPWPCDYCWVGTPAENDCPSDWYGTSDGCDCGCQWEDPDCGGCNPVCGDGICEPDCDEDCSSCPQDCGSCCGNGVVNEPEECDDGGESATCDADCTLVACGDDTLNLTAGEECEPPGGECCDTACHFEPAGAACGDDSNPCTDDACDGAGTCAHVGDDTNDCDDGAFCNGAEYCESSVCVSPGDPCAGGEECRATCDEAEDDCFDPAGAACGDGPTGCSGQDTCDGAGNCIVNDLPAGTACGDPSDTACDRPDSCDGAGTCLPNYAPPEASCEDGETCNGAETCDGSGTCVRHLVEDCNENDVEDSCDISDGTSPDCNGNATPDECDIAQGTSPDENGNGTPDECDITVYLDIKPGSCPNPVNPQSKGVVPVAVLGTEQVDVTQIDVGTLTIRRADGVGGTVSPLSGPPGPGVTIGDVATPFDADSCDCHDADGDGFDDLLLKFSTPELADALGLGRMPRGEPVMLTVGGSLLDGTVFEASDCIVIPGGPRSQAGLRQPRGSK